MSKAKVAIILTVLVDVIGIGIVIPSLPFYVLDFGVGAATITTLFAVFSLCSFFSTPVLGVLSDRYGRRPILIASIFSTALGWLMFALAPSIIWLFIGRIIDGLAAGNISTAHSVITDLSVDDKDRTHNLGVLGAVFGIGFIIGPAIGGLLGSAHPHAPFWFVTILATLNLLFVYFFLPETNKHLADKFGLVWWQQIHPLRPVIAAAKNKILRPLYSVWFLFSLALATQQSVMALYLLQIFNVGIAGTGWLMAGVGVGIALNQGVGLKHFWLKKFAEPDLQLWLLLVMFIAFIFLSLPAGIYFIVGMILNIICQSVLRVVMTSQMVGAAPLNGRGEVIGVLNSIMSLGMVAGPLIAGALFNIKPALPFWLAAGFMFLAFITVLCQRKKISLVPTVETPETNMIMD